MGTPTSPTIVTGPISVTPVKISLLKHIGSIIGKIARVFTKDVVPAEPMIAKALEAFLPQFAPVIAVGDGLFTKIAKQVLVTEASAASIASPPAGTTKLQQATSAVEDEIDQWVRNLFPGADTVEAAEKSGLVQAIFAIVNKQKPSALLSAS
jgi:hypothetical protein